MPTTRVYTGIGSRETPQGILEVMQGTASRLAERGWTVRSGGAPGAAVEDVGLTEIYLPWKGFGDWHEHQVARLEAQPEAWAIAEVYHPRWQYLKHGAKMLHARNVHQILGYDVTEPQLPSFVLCWTKDGKGGGGTGQALRIAKGWEVPIFDLGLDWTSALFRDMLSI